MAELSTKSKIALARAVQGMIMSGRRLLGAGPRTQVVRRGVRWDLDLSEGIDFAIYLLGGFELRTLKLYRQLVRPGAVVLDVGANIGAHTLPLAALVGPSGLVMAFEPTKFAFSKLQQNLELNPALLERVRPLQMALLSQMDKPLPRSIYSSWPLDGSSVVHEIHGGKLCATDGATVSTVDAVVESMTLKSVDFVKLDVDGHEPDVLLGAMKTLERFRPTILMEWGPGYSDGEASAFNEALGALAAIGYRFQSFGRGDPRRVTQDELSRVVAPGASVNVVLRCAPTR